MANKVTTVVPKEMQPSTATAVRRVGLSGDGSTVTRAQVAARAFEIFKRRCQNRQPGDAVSDWLTAEAELRSGK